MEWAYGEKYKNIFKFWTKLEKYITYKIWKLFFGRIFEKHEYKIHIASIINSTVKYKRQFNFNISALTMFPTIEKLQII